MWFWLALSAGVASATDKVINNAVLRNKGNASAYSLFYISIITIISLIIAYPFDINFSFELVGIIIIQSILWSFGTIFSFMSHTHSDVSLNSIIMRSRIIWLIPLGYIVLGERLSLITILSIVIIFIGFVVLFYKKKYHKDIGVIFMFLSSIFVALGTVANAMLVRDFLTPSEVTFFTMLGQIPILSLILMTRDNSIKRLKKLISNKPLLILLAPLVETYAFITINKAYQLGSASSATAVYQGVSIITVLMGVVFLKEKEIKRKLVSSTIVIVGIILLKLYG